MKHIVTDTPRPDSVAMIAKDFSATATDSPAIGISATGTRYIPVDLDSITDGLSITI